MAGYFYHWTPRVIEKLAQHDVTREEFIAAFEDRIEDAFSRSTGLPAFYGYDDRGRLLFGIYEHLKKIDIFPKTAYEVEDRYG
jgi:hypothetical protein